MNFFCNYIDYFNACFDFSVPVVFAIGVGAIIIGIVIRLLFSSHDDDGKDDEFP